VSGTPIAFVKGHGTENDFVLLPDPDGTLELTAGLTRALCDRHAGLGADGAIRVARDGTGGFLMDYRNADGSLAEMCGNGARVFARFLVDAGWADPGRIEFATRGGPRWAELGPTGDVTIGMGPVRVGAPTTATIAGDEIPGVAVDVGNPHLVCPVSQDPAAFDLTVAPTIDAALFPDGANVELVQAVGPGEVLMRVHERGVGETRSCGTGTVAAAAAHLAAAGRADGTVRVRVPGGTVTVQIVGGPAGGRANGPADGPANTATLTGPAVLVASGTVRPEWFAAAS
jgi:diaminopimelate epimerase